jgi:hypothetical protein
VNKGERRQCIQKINVNYNYPQALEPVVELWLVDSLLEELSGGT